MKLSTLLGKKVLITGGTKGLGKAIAIAFAKAGAVVFITHKWGSVDEKLIINEFNEQNLAAPYIVQADVGVAEDNLNLLKFILKTASTLDVIISNVAFSKVIEKTADLKQNTLQISLNYSAWPLVDLTLKSREVFGKYPRYILAISSDGPDVCHPGYDMAGTAKAVLETLCKYLALRLRPDDVRVNALRPGFMLTDSATATFSPELLKIIYKKMPELFIEPSEVANVCVGLCSGLMDAITGQIITVDGGSSLVSPIVYLTKE